MGEFTEMVIDGDLCSCCGVYISPGQGFPRLCRDCRRDCRRAEKGYQGGAVATTSKVNCPQCWRRVKPTGLLDHTRAMHGREKGGV